MANAEPQIIEVAPGIRTGLWHWQPPSPARIRRAVLILPALGVRAAAYRHLAQALNGHGLDVLALDLRGVGSSSVRASRRHDWGYQDLLDDELECLLAQARQRLPQAPLAWLGHSLGGHLAVLHALLRGNATPDLQHLLLVASGSPHLPLLARREARGARFLTAMINLSTPLLGAFRGDWLGFGGRQGSRLMREWARLVRAGTLPLGDPRGPIDRPTVAAFTMAGDHYAPKASVQALADRLGQGHAAETIGPDEEGRLPGHFDWMKRPERIARALALRVCGSD